MHWPWPAAARVRSSKPPEGSEKPLNAWVPMETALLESAPLEWDALLHRLSAHEGVTKSFLKNCHTIFEASSVVPLICVGFSHSWVGAEDFHETTLVKGFDPRAGHVSNSA
mmetsp:Transcript_19279/g.67103  ORF Transcript_19279/g.67103 Transcript_19279/m.67103 type:complete len:111 (+) Transcript_19279:451-783(+)